MSKKKQTLLGDFGFMKTVIHQGEEIKTPLPYIETTVKNLKCQQCSKEFVNQQGLSVHLKCVHNDASSEKHTQKQMDTSSFENKIVEQTTASLLNSPIEEQDEIIDVDREPSTSVSAKKKSRGQDVRKQYPAHFKAKVINAIEAGDSPSDMTEKYKISKSMVSNWLKNKVKIMDQAASEHKKHLKIRPAKNVS